MKTPRRLRSLALLILAASSLSGQATRPAARSAEHGFDRNVGVLVFEGVELLDFAGPVEVFSNANGWDTPFRTFTVAVDASPVRSRNGTVILPDRTIADAPPLDVLVIPGGEVRCLGPAYPLGRFIKDQASRIEIVFSICNGAFALADAGLLDGLEATTHRSMIAWLREAAPKAVVRADRRVVDNGHIVTAAGISAGIDAALHLVGRLLGPETAVKVARRIEYDWRESPDTRPATDRIERARRAWYAGQWQVAADEYAPIVQDRPEDVVALSRLGTGLAFSKQPEAALPHLEKAVRLGSSEAGTYQALAFSLGKLGRPSERLPLLIRARELDPTSGDVIQTLGGAYSEAGRHAEAIPLLKSALKQGRGDSRTFGLLARSQASVGDLSGALESLTQAVDEDHSDPQRLLSDPIFAALANDPRFTALQAIAASRPAK